MKEKCGVVAIYSYSGNPVSRLIVTALEALQHRGQEAWGLAVNGSSPLKFPGLVRDGFLSSSSEIEAMNGNRGIGHVRYSTKGNGAISNAHPISISSEIYIAHNGTICNFDDFQGQDGIEKSMTDTEILGNRLLSLYKKEKDWVQVFRKADQLVKGSYSLVIMTKSGELIAARDPQGFRPLCYGKLEDSNSIVVASESCALSALGAVLIGDIPPGNILSLEHDGAKLSEFRKSSTHSHCAFEYTYFAHPSSVIEGINVYQARKKIGRILAKKLKKNADVVIPVPDSARPAALGYAEESGINLEEGLMKDRYSKRGRVRSFIEPNEESREEVNKKIIAIPSTVKGKEVLVIDDSIVRGTSSSIISSTLKGAGAKKVSLAVTFPPVAFPCYAGIDFPSKDELAAGRGELKDDDLAIPEKVATEVGVDELDYNDKDGLSKGIGLPLSQICTSCITGDYSNLGFQPKIRTRHEMKDE
ncbi:MAG: amidophosphoribosyltransferase [Nitrososphaerales archaeon]